MCLLTNIAPIIHPNLHKRKGVNQENSVWERQKSSTDEFSCISAQKGVAFFGQMVYNRPTGRERLERTNEFIWPTSAKLPQIID
jgi:hypothetical protein